MAAQLPKFTNDIELDGNDALGYVDDLRRILPGTKWYFFLVDQVLNCASSGGVVAARAYLGGSVAQGFVSATAVVVLSKRQVESLPQVLVDCAVKKIAEPFGGPTDGFSPCLEAYYYDVAGVDRYFVFVASTTQAYCTGVRSWHAQAFAINNIWSIGT